MFIADLTLRGRGLTDEVESTIKILRALAGGVGFLKGVERLLHESAPLKKQSPTAEPDVQRMRDVIAATVDAAPELIRLRVEVETALSAIQSLWAGKWSQIGLPSSKELLDVTH